jgi:DNA polymerase I-like protein with 3'-5' exonuclease and polymerase domains
MNKQFIHITGKEAAMLFLGYALDNLLTQDIYLDTETSGLDCSDPLGLKVIQLGFEVDYELKVVLISNKLMYDPTVQPLLISFFHQCKQLIIHNAKFDLKFLVGMGCELDKLAFFDTMLAIKILYNGLLKFGGAGLNDIYKGVTGQTLDKRYGKLPWSKEILEPDMLEYAASDIYSLHLIHKAYLAFEFRTFPALLKINYLKMLWFEHLLLPVVAKMELRGMYVSLDEIEKVRQQIAPEAKVLEHEIIQTLKEVYPPFENPNSPVQLQRAFQELGLEHITSFSKDTLPDYSEDHPVIDKLLEYKTKTKLLQFLTSIEESISQYTGRVHGSFNQIGTDTGRLSASQPNLQNLPRDKRIRNIFQAGSYDRVLVVADYSQLELVIAAQITEDPQMVYAYSNDLDIHKITANFVTGKPLEDITKDDRQIAKAVNFG